jgi:HPt (histidine-containing phosphotransfer) domain-containing protein
MEEAKNFSPAANVDLPELLTRVDNDRELLRDLIAIFKEEFPQHLHALQEAVAREDCKQVATVSHTLKGMLANLAVNRAAASAAHLEELARSDNHKRLKDALAAFEENVHGLLPEMETYLVEVQP